MREEVKSTQVQHIGLPQKFYAGFFVYCKNNCSNYSWRCNPLSQHILNVLKLQMSTF